MSAEEKTYIIKKAITSPKLKGNWDNKPWSEANVDKIETFAPESSDHRPTTEFKLLYDDEAVYVHFRVQDKYIIALAEKNQAGVCGDACAEFFVWPTPGQKGYFNFEVNCGGTVLCFYIPGWERTEGGFKERYKVSDKWLDKLNIFHTMPKNITEEIEEEKTWQIEYKIPKALFEDYIKEDLGNLQGQKWTANFYKCGDNCSHPHWAMWKDCTPPLNFHQPEKFGKLVFE